MSKKQIIDITGTPLRPSRHGKKCLGNGEHSEYECCCDECDFYLKCFPEWDWRLKRNRFKRWIGKVFRIESDYLDPYHSNQFRTGLKTGKK